MLVILEKTIAQDTFLLGLPVYFFEENTMVSALLSEQRSATCDVIDRFSKWRTKNRKIDKTVKHRQFVRVE